MLSYTVLDTVQTTNMYGCSPFAWMHVVGCTRQRRVIPSHCSQTRRVTHVERELNSWKAGDDSSMPCGEEDLGLTSNQERGETLMAVTNLPKGRIKPFYCVLVSDHPRV